jgi:hypothetical protein
VSLRLHFLILLVMIIEEVNAQNINSCVAVQHNMYSDDNKQQRIVQSVVKATSTFSNE